MDLQRLTRRRFLVRAAVPAIAAGVVAGSPRLAVAARSVVSVAVLPATGPGPIPVTLDVNGQSRALRIEPRVTLLDALRERLQLTGTKKGCDQGTCGACTVLVGGRRVNACLTLAVMAQGKPITTVEGLAHGEQLHPVQAAFIAHDGFQCGYCTPGQIMSAVAVLAEKRPLDEGSVREWMSGNICRCGAYPNIVAAVREAGGRS
jgi:xanthine dehydrogenase YagT iron-sulfur-binding subunit